MSKSQFDEINRRLEASGQTHPAGRIAHIGYGPDDAIEVVDVWDNDKSFEKFGALLMPILAEVGVDVGEPQIAPVQRILVAPA
jgi:hypothetical protein